MRPRELVHRGHVVAAALRIEVGRIGVAEARRRVLELWTPGCALRALGDDWLLVLAEPRRLPASEAPGQVLVREGGSLVALPGAEGPVGDVVQARGGQVVAVASGSPVDPAEWLDLDAFESVALRPLAAPAPPVEVLAEEAPGAEAYRVREPGPEAEALRDALANPKPPWWAPLAKWLIQRSSGESTAGAGRGGSGSGSTGADPIHLPVDAPPPSPPGFLSRLLSRLRLDALFGSQASKLIQKLIDELESGDPEAALRRAIPLGGASSGGGAFSFRWDLPFRTDLAVGPRSGGDSGGSLPLAPTLYERLQQTYEALAARLERAGHVEQAAYILGELLDRPEDAVALCERHERWALAARIAEVRGLQTAMVVRLWAQAGDVDRAFAIAKLTGTLGPALVQLEQHDRERGRGLRVRWARGLADGGRFLAAVELLDPLGPPVPTLAYGIAELGIRAGGAAAGILAVKRLSWGPSDAAADHLRSLFDDRSDARRDERLSAAHALSAVDGRTPEPWLFRVAFRSLVRDERVVGTRPGVRQKLVAGADDPVLRADLPTEAFPEPSLFGDGTGPVMIEVPARGTGLRIEAIAGLSDRGVAVALGEAGLRLFDPRGRVRAHLEHPVRALVPSVDRTVLLALEHPRGRSRVWRVDPFSGEATLWADLELGPWAPDFDGLTWVVSTDGRLQVLDVGAERARALWSVRMERVAAVLQSTPWLLVLAEGESWSYRFDGREPVLKKRAELEDLIGPAVALTVGGVVASWVPRELAGEHFQAVAARVGRVGGRPVGEVSFSDLGEGADAVLWARPCGTAWLFAADLEGQARRLLLYGDATRFRPLLRVELEAQATATDPGAERLLVGTEDGQVLEVDLRTGRKATFRVR